MSQIIVWTNIRAVNGSGQSGTQTEITSLPSDIRWYSRTALGRSAGGYLVHGRYFGADLVYGPRSSAAASAWRSLYNPTNPWINILFPDAYQLPSDPDFDGFSPGRWSGVLLEPHLEWGSGPAVYSIVVPIRSMELL